MKISAEMGVLLPGNKEGSDFVGREVGSVAAIGDSQILE